MESCDRSDNGRSSHSFKESTARAWTCQRERHAEEPRISIGVSLSSLSKVKEKVVRWALGGCLGVPAGCADARRLEASQNWCSSTPLEAFLGSLTRRRGAAQLSAKYNVLLHVTLVAFVRVCQRIPLPWTTTIFTPNACYVVSTHVFDLQQFFSAVCYSLGTIYRARAFIPTH